MQWYMPQVLQCIGCQQTMLTTTYGMVQHLEQKCPNTVLKRGGIISAYKAQPVLNKCQTPASEPTTQSATDVKMHHEAAT